MTFIKRYLSKRALIVGGLTVGLIVSFTGCKMHTYEVTKMDGSKELVKAGYFHIKGSYLNFYTPHGGLVKTIRAESARRIKTN